MLINVNQRFLKQDVLLSKCWCVWFVCMQTCYL